MIFKRWQAPQIPTKDQILMIFQSEGLLPQEETLAANFSSETHRHCFDEVRMIVSGQLEMDIAGNKLLLRPGDRIEIPSNTTHKMQVGAEEQCISIFSQRAL